MFFFYKADQKQGNGKYQTKITIYLFENEFHANSEFLLRVDLQFVELFDQNVELLRAKFVQDAASLAKQHLSGILYTIKGTKLVK